MIFDGTNQANKDQRLYYASMGKLFRVVGIAKNAEQANAFAERKNDWKNQHGVIGETAEGHPVIAEFHGEKISSK